ncbi:MAG: hypothetical protein MI919_33740, partial [Holophagales bacterium]|nr:hypothetical protein [Holophagales bacterium]
ILVPSLCSAVPGAGAVDLEVAGLGPEHVERADLLHFEAEVPWPEDETLVLRSEDLEGSGPAPAVAPAPVASPPAGPPSEGTLAPTTQVGDDRGGVHEEGAGAGVGLAGEISDSPEAAPPDTGSSPPASSAPVASPSLPSGSRSPAHEDGGGEADEAARADPAAAVEGGGLRGLWRRLRSRLEGG